MIVSCAGSASLADLLVGTAFEGGVRRIDEMTREDLPNGVSPGSMAFTSGVTVGPDGHIYASSRFSGQVLRFDGQTGSPLGVFATLTPLDEEHVPAPGPLRFGPDGNLYVSDFGAASVRRFDALGVEIAPSPATVFVGPSAGLTFDSSGDLYVGDFGSASVLRFSGGVPAMFVPPQSGGLMSPSSLLFLPNNNLLVVDLFGDQILEYASDGSFVRQFAEIEIDLGPNPPPNADPTDNPSDVVYDGDGNLIVAVLGATQPSFPPDPPTQTYGTLLKFDLDGGDQIQTILSDQTPFSSVAWIKSANAIPGNYDSDSGGMVDSADYDKWRTDFGKTVAKGGGADGNGNGFVDAADYVLWRKMLPAAGSSDGGGVPEPSTAALMALAALLAFGFQRR